MSAVRYLSRPEVAERIGVTKNTIDKYALPEPDAIVGRRAGWLPQTVDEWNANRPGRGRWGRPETASGSELAEKADCEECRVGADPHPHGTVLEAGA